MPTSLVDQLRQLAESFDEFAGDVGNDELLPSVRRRSPQRHVLVTAAALLVIVAGLIAIDRVRDRDSAPTPTSEALAGSELADALVASDWVAIDFPIPNLPWLHFEHDDGVAVLDVRGYDGCNSQDGQLRIDGRTVADGRVASTAMACSNVPLTAGLWTGATLTSTGDELVVTDTDGRSTRYVALDSFDEVSSAELVGTYTVGATPVAITETAIAVDGCSRGWADDGGAVVLTGPACESQPFPNDVLTSTVRWDAVVGGAESVVVTVGDRFVRLDRTTPDAPTRPGLASFLGAIGDHTWVYDAPLADYPLADRPSLRPPGQWTADGDLLVSGFDGCNTYSAKGRWIPAHAGWTLEATEQGSTMVYCEDRPTVSVFSGDALALSDQGLLVVTHPDGTTHAFRDIGAEAWTDPLRGPLTRLPGQWELDPGVVIEITPAASDTQRGKVRLGSCTVDWWMVSYEWIGAGPVPAGCAGEVSGPSAGVLLQLLDAGPNADPAVPLVERPVTIGFNPDGSVLYLAGADSTTVLRLTKVG